MPSLNGGGSYATTVAIGGLAITIHTTSAEFIPLLESRYAGFLVPPDVKLLTDEISYVRPGRRTSRHSARRLPASWGHRAQTSWHRSLPFTF